MSTEPTSVAASLVITDADCGAVSRHDHLDGWSIKLEPEGTWIFTWDKEGASSVSGRREWGTYELGEEALRLLAQKARAYCGMGDPGDLSGEDLEWEPAEPVAFCGLAGAAVAIEGKTRTIHYEKAADREDVAQAQARAKEAREAQNAFAAEVSRLAGVFRHLRRPVVAEALRRAGGDAGRAEAELRPQEEAAAEEFEAKKAAKLLVEAKRQQEKKEKHEERVQEQLLEQFKRLDASGEGRVSLEVLRRVLQSSAGEKVWPDAKVETLFRLFNADADGRIQYGELLAWVFGAKDDSSSSMLLPEGGRVEAKCSGWTRYYRGRITRVNPGETYDILFDDGERKRGVERSQIRTL